MGCAGASHGGHAGPARKFRVLGFRVLGFRVLGFRVLGFRVLGFRVLGFLADLRVAVLIVKFIFTEVTR